MEFSSLAAILLPMFCVSVLYPANSASTFNLDYYLDSHIPLAKKLLTPHGLQRVEVTRSVALPPGASVPFHTIGQLYFATMQDLEKGLASAGQQLIEDIPNYYSGGEHIVQINEVVLS
jgi:uncharacterized protein (TIGR02118 family)